MALVPRLDLRQVQNLVMTPQLQQAIRLLQLSNLELAEYVEREIEENPLLQREEGERDNDGPDPGRESGGDGEPGEDGLDAEQRAELASLTGDPDDQRDSVDLVDSGTIAVDGEDGLDADFDNVWSGDSAADSVGTVEADTLHWQVSGAGGFDGDGPDLENAPADEISLRDHLLEQVNVDLSDPIDRLIALHLLDALDDNGYIGVDPDEIALALGCEAGRVARTLERLQRFDPPGIFARNLAECLKLQLIDRNRFDPAMEALLANLDLLARREFTALRKLCGVSQEDLIEMIDEIKALNPKPAQLFNYAVAQPVTPDVTVRRSAEHGWVVELNTETLPRVLVNNKYYVEVSRQASSKRDREYISECYQSASWLVRALHQRAQTILKVATEVVKRQEAFLENGVRDLKPLVLRDIAQELDIHESTVSRVTNNKYIATPRGIFELKYFFTFAVGDAEGGSAKSAEAIRFRIKELIDQETVDNVLSDDKIVSILRGRGVDIARRTVAKYRESMHIPSSVQRRREKGLQA